jgi:hypothetical protein
LQVHLDGRAVQRALDEAAASGPAERREAMKFWGSVVALVSGVETSAVVAKDGSLVDTLLRLPVAQVAAAPALIDEWLRSKELRNSWALPRPLTSDELKHPLKLTVRSPGLRDLQRAFPATNRLSVGQGKAAAFVLSVLPQASAAPQPPPSPPPGQIDPTLAATAREVVGRRSSPAERAAAIATWVHDHMTYELTSGQYDDLTLLARKRGDCTEFAQLTIALLQAAAIPARPRTGFLAAGDRLVAHAWLEFHDGKVWREIDPTNARSEVDSSYIDASVLDVLGLVASGQLEIVGVE